MARFVAKNLVANGFAKQCLVSVAYAIGKAEPLMVEAINEKGESLAEIVKKNFDLQRDSADKYYDNLVDMARTNSDLIVKINKARADKMMAIDRIEYEQKMMLVLDGADRTLKTMQMVGEASHANALVQKRIAEGITIVKGAEATVSAFEAGWETGGVYLAIAYGALAAIETAAQVSIIEQQSFAAGGISRGGWARVGEQGMENVYLPSGARVYNNTETKNMMAGHTFNISLNGNTTRGDIDYLVDNIDKVLLKAKNTNRLVRYENAR
jgi:hypothetical protein